jgi:hypothetical protein
MCWVRNTPIVLQIILWAQTCNTLVWRFTYFEFSKVSAIPLEHIKTSCLKPTYICNTFIQVVILKKNCAFSYLLEWTKPSSMQYLHFILLPFLDWARPNSTLHIAAINCKSNCTEYMASNNKENWDQGYRLIDCIAISHPFCYLWCFPLDPSKFVSLSLIHALCQVALENSTTTC